MTFCFTETVGKSEVLDDMAHSECGDLVGRFREKIRSIKCNGARSRLIMRLRQLNSVVLPAPFGPISPQICPGGTSKLMSSSARMPPKFKVMPRKLDMSDDNCEKIARSFQSTSRILDAYDIADRNPAGPVEPKGLQLRDRPIVLRRDRNRNSRQEKRKTHAL